MGKLIVWQKKWDTGIKDIDEQHHHFVEMLNKDYSIAKKISKDKIEEALNDVLEYARVHFSTEEQYFDETNYPGADEHKMEHKDLLAQAIKFEVKFENSKDYLALIGEFLVFLRSWLDNHLVEYDHKYVPWLTSHGIK